MSAQPWVLEVMTRNECIARSELNSQLAWRAKQANAGVSDDALAQIDARTTELRAIWKAADEARTAVSELIAADVEYDKARIKHVESTMHAPNPAKHPTFDELQEAAHRRAIALAAVTKEQR